jgi:hypothetical protein
MAAYPSPSRKYATARPGTKAGRGILERDEETDEDPESRHRGVLGWGRNLPQLVDDAHHQQRVRYEADGGRKLDPRARDARERGEPVDDGDPRQRGEHDRRVRAARGALARQLHHGEDERGDDHDLPAERDEIDKG